MGLLDFSAFSLRALGDTLTVITVANRFEITDVGELEALIRSVVESREGHDKRSIAVKRTDSFNAKKKRLDRFPKIRCPECNQFMRPMPVNDKDSTMVGGDYKSCTICYNQECLHTIYHEKTVQELIEESRGETK